MAAIAEHGNDRVPRPEPPRGLDRGTAMHGGGRTHEESTHANTIGTSICLTTGMPARVSAKSARKGAAGVCFIPVHAPCSPHGTRGELGASEPHFVQNRVDNSHGRIEVDDA